MAKEIKFINKNKLYTGRGDNGTTTLFHCNQGRISKDANIMTLGSLDELNAYLGVVKMMATNEQLKVTLSPRKKF